MPKRVCIRDLQPLLLSRGVLPGFLAKGCATLTLLSLSFSKKQGRPGKTRILSVLKRDVLKRFAFAFGVRLHSEKAPL